MCSTGARQYQNEEVSKQNATDVRASAGPTAGGVGGALSAPTPKPCRSNTGGPLLPSPMRQKCTRGLHGWSHSHHCECGSSATLG